MDSRPAHLQVQVHHVVPVQEGHAAQDLPGQPDHVFLCEGFVVVGDALVEDLATGGAAGRGRGGGSVKGKLRTTEGRQR